MSRLTDTETLTRWEKLATWWPDCSHDIRYHSSKNWPQGNGNKSTLELKINSTWNNQDDASRSTACPIARWRSELTVMFSTCSPLPQPIKALAPWLLEVGAASQPLNRSPLPFPPPRSAQVAGIQNKTNSFPPTWLALLLAFELQVAGPHFQLGGEHKSSPCGSLCLSTGLHGTFSGTFSLNLRWPQTGLSSRCLPPYHPSIPVASRCFQEHLVPFQRIRIATWDF